MAQQDAEIDLPETSILITPRPVPLSVLKSSFIQRLAATTFIANLVPKVRAFNQLTCCMTRARQFVLELDDNPWTVCSAGVTDPWNQTPPRASVTANLGWCLEHCPGYATTSLEDWLHPLAQWFVPYATLLVLCPIGDGREEGEVEKGILSMVLDYAAQKLCLKAIEETSDQVDKEEEHFKRHNFSKRLLEWAKILGDPASAIWGAIAQLNMDWWIVQRLRNKKSPHGVDSDVDWYNKEMLGVVVMAGQTAMNRRLGCILTRELIIKALVAAVAMSLPLDDEEVYDNATKSLHQSLLRLAKTISDANNNASILENIPDEELPNLSVEVKDFMTGSNGLKEFLTILHEKLTSDQTHTTLSDDIHAVIQALDASSTNPSAISSPSLSGPNYNDSAFSLTLRKGIRTILEARRTFMTAIALPVVIHFATTAQLFYESYQKLGDHSTAEGLAYGALYSWLLVVAVVSNCALASANAGLIKQQIKEIFTLSGIRVPLSDRYSNALEWECWLTDIGLHTELQDKKGKSSERGQTTDTRTVAFKGFYAKYVMGQLVGWFIVAFFCGCAITISYTTPTVGWGCRSLNHLIYAVLSLLVALLQVWKHKVERTDLETFGMYPISRGMKDEEAQPTPDVIRAEVVPKSMVVETVNSGPDENESQTANPSPMLNPPRWRSRLWRPSPKRSATSRLIRILYTFLMTLNIFVLIVGTVLNWAGVYNNCRCKHVFGPADHPLEMNGNTQLALDMARKYWNSTGYVAYLGAWCICAVAVVVRKFLQGTMAVEFMVEDESSKSAKRKQLEDSGLSLFQTSIWPAVEKVGGEVIE